VCIKIRSCCLIAVIIVAKSLLIINLPEVSVLNFKRAAFDNNFDFVVKCLKLNNAKSTYLIINVKKTSVEV